MTSKKNPLDSIILISVPENLQSVPDNIKLDPSILLPIEVPEGIPPAEWNIENLSWEMIFSGMLKILAYDPGHQHAQYYRNFILTVKPQIIQELTKSAIIKSQTHNYELSEEIFKALIGLQPEELRHRLNLAIMFENRSNHLSSLDRAEESKDFQDLAEEFYLQLIEKGENLPDIFFNAAWFFFSKQDFSRTTELLTTYIQLADDEAKLSEAKKLLKESESLKDGSDKYSKAYALISQDNNQEGIELIEDFLQDNPLIWNAWFLKGWGYRKLQKYKEALDAFLKARDLDPSRVEVFNEMAICHLEMEEYKEAENLLSEAFQLDPENVKVISNMGILSLKQHQYDKAIGFFNTVLELEPEDPIALEYIDFLKKK